MTSATMATVFLRKRRPASFQKDTLSRSWMKFSFSCEEAGAKSALVSSLQEITSSTSSWRDPNLAFFILSAMLSSPFRG